MISSTTTTAAQVAHQIPSQLPTIGRIVHFFDGTTTLAAIVIDLPATPSIRAEGACSLSVWRPHREDLHITPVFYSENKRPQTWCWPPRT